jgi:hypothetical protein
MFLEFHVVKTHETVTVVLVLNTRLRQSRNFNASTYTIGALTATTCECS